MANFPGPWQVRLNYSVLAGGFTDTHQQRLNCDMDTAGNVGDGFADFSVKRRNAAALSLFTAINDWVDLIDAVYNQNSTFIDAELWKYTAGTDDAAWYSSQSISQAGASVANAIRAQESIMTFRTFGGGSMRLHFMETITAAGITDFPPFSAEYEAISSFVLGDGNWILARDNTYPATDVALHPGVNERLFKKAFRP